LHNLQGNSVVCLCKCLISFRQKLISHIDYLKIRIALSFPHFISEYSLLLKVESIQNVKHNICCRPLGITAALIQSHMTVVLFFFSSIVALPATKEQVARVFKPCLTNRTDSRTLDVFIFKAHAGRDNIPG